MNQRESFSANIDEWKMVHESKEPYKMPFPTPWNEKLNDFQRLMIVRCMRPDKVIRYAESMVYFNFFSLNSINAL